MAVACGSEERKSCVENIIYGNYLSDVEREESGMLLWQIIKRKESMVERVNLMLLLGYPHTVIFKTSQ